MPLAALLALAHLAALSPRAAACPEQPPSSAERALSEQPYDEQLEPGCREVRPDLRPAPKPGELPENAAQELTQPELARAGYSLLGTGAAFAMLGGSMLYFSRTALTEGGRDFFRATWPLTAGLGGALAVGGLGLVGYSAWVTPAPGAAPGIQLGATGKVAFELVPQPH